MTVPMDLAYAQRDFEKFLADIMEVSGMETRHRVYTMVYSVLLTFRRRLSVKEGLAFADVLPPILRAMFVESWNIDEPTRPFLDRESMTREVLSVREAHNVSPDTVLHDVAVALRRNVDEAAFDRVLATLPEGAAEFWRV